MQVLQSEIFKACLQFQTSLDNSPLAPINQERKATPILDWVRSAENTRGTVMTPLVAQVQGNDFHQAPTAAGCQKIQIEYTPQYCGGEVQDFDPSECGTAGVCEEGEKSGPRKGYLTFDLDQGKEKKGSISECDWDCLCTGETPSNALLRDLEDAAFDLKQAKNKYVVEQLVASLGSYKEGEASNSCDTIREVPLYNFSEDGCAKLHHAAMAYMRKVRRKARYNGAIKYFGGEVVADFSEMNPLVTAENGANVTGTFSNFQYDPCIDEQVDPLICDDGSSYILAIAPGAFQYAEYVRNTGSRVKNFENMSIRTITIGGDEYDFYLYFDKCTLCWNWVLRTTYGSTCLPDEIYCNPYNAHKLAYKATCGPWNCDLMANC